jgi:SnoaL-like protein
VPPPYSSRTQLDRVAPIVGDASGEDMNMRNWSVVVLVVAFAAPAFADATADARAHDEAFAKACEAGDVKDVLALYADDAVVVWPGAGEEAKGKAAIEKLIPDLCNPRTIRRPSSSHSRRCRSAILASRSSVTGK